MIRTIDMNGGVLEHLIGMVLRADSHVLLTEMLDMRIDVCTS